MMQDPSVVGKNFGSFPSNFFTQPFQYFRTVNLVYCLSSWYKFIKLLSSAATASTRWRVCELYCRSILVCVCACVCVCIYIYICIRINILFTDSSLPSIHDKDGLFSTGDL